MQNTKTVVFICNLMEQSKVGTDFKKLLLALDLLVGVLLCFQCRLALRLEQRQLGVDNAVVLKGKYK